MSFFRVVGQIFLFFTVLALALISVSAPIVPRIAFLKGQFSQDITLLLGLSGGCITVGKSQTCPSAQLGYSITLDNFPDKTSEGPEPLNSTLTYALVVFPLAAIIGLLAFATSLPRRSRFFRWITLSLIIVTFILTTIGFGVALGLFVLALNRINDQFAPASPASLGPAIWVALAAVILVAFSGLLIASSKPTAKSTSDNITMKSKGNTFQAVEPVNYKQQYGSYTRPTISDPQYVHQGMKMDFEPRPHEGYYSGDSVRTESVYSGDADPFHASSYYGGQIQAPAVGKSKSMSGGRQSGFGFRRSASRSHTKSKR